MRWCIRKHGQVHECPGDPMSDTTLAITSFLLYMAFAYRMGKAEDRSVYQRKEWWRIRNREERVRRGNEQHQKYD